MQNPPENGWFLYVAISTPHIDWQWFPNWRYRPAGSSAFGAMERTIQCEKKQTRPVSINLQAVGVPQALAHLLLEGLIAPLRKKPNGRTDPWRGQQSLGSNRRPAFNGELMT